MSDEGRMKINATELETRTLDELVTEVRRRGATLLTVGAVHLMPDGSEPEDVFLCVAVGCRAAEVAGAVSAVDTRAGVFQFDEET